MHQKIKQPWVSEMVITVITIKRDAPEGVVMPGEWRGESKSLVIGLKVP